MRRTIVAVILAALLLLMMPAAASAAGVTVVGKAGDGIWTDDTWTVNIYPGETKSTTITINNSSSSSLGVEVAVLPESFDNGNLTFDLDKSSFTMSGGTSADVALTVKANGSATPGTYTAELEIKSEVEPYQPPYQPPPPAPPEPPPGTTDVRGMVGAGCRFIEPVSAISDDELCTLTIPVGTVGLTEDLECLPEITMVTMDDPPPPPADAHVIGLVYDFGPDGATFDPAVTLTFTYDPDSLPEGVSEEDLVIAYFIDGEWIELEGVIDTETNTITASVSHFTTFALIGTPPTVVVEKPIVVIKEPVVEEKEEPVVEKEEPVVEEEPAVVEKAEEPVVEEEEEVQEAAGINWAIVGWAIVGVVVAGLIVFFLIRRRKALVTKR